MNLASANGRTNSRHKLIYILCALILIVCSHDRALAAGTVASINGGTSIRLSTGAAYGVFDPSIADTATGTRAWMSYTANNPSLLFPSSNPIVQSTRLAYSDDAGATWKDAGVVVNAVTEATTVLGKISWTNEVSSLVYDAAAPSGSRWKLFWLHYAIINGVRQFSDSWIGYKNASQPTGLASANEIKLFAGTGYDTANNNLNGTTASPVGGAPGLFGSRFQSSDCAAFSEPGATASGSAVYIALNCSATAVRTVLLKCADPCTASYAGGWAFSGNPLTASDSTFFGTTALSGQDIFYEGGNAYLIVSPVGNSPISGAYQGCLVFQFTNIAVGAISRINGNPQPVQLVGGDVGSFNGACTRAQHVTAAGYAYGEIAFSAAMFPTFNIYLTGSR